MLGLIDFYHAAKQLSDQRSSLRHLVADDPTHPLAQPHAGPLLKRARVDEVIQSALRELCRGRTAGRDPHCTSTTS